MLEAHISPCNGLYLLYKYVELLHVLFIDFIH